MRVELKPKSVSKLRTLIGNFRNVGGGMVQSVINYILGIHCTLDTTNFDKNLDSTIVDCQKLADAVDELVLGGTLPAGIENQTLRYNSSNELEANDNLQIFIDRTQNTVPFAICDITENPTVLYTETQFLQKKYNETQTLGHEIVDFDIAIRIINAINNGLYILGDTLHFILLATETDPEVVMDITYDGKWNGAKYYKKSITAPAKQYNNIVVDENGNFEKQLKNIAVIETGVLIDSNTLMAITDLEVDAMRGNIYHLEFRFILKRLIQEIPYDTFGASGFQFQFTNAGVNELEFLGGIDFSILLYGINSHLSSYVQSYSNEFHNPIGDYIYDVNLENISTDATVDMVVIHGTGIFKQSPENETINDNLSVLVAKVTDDEDYTLEKGSFVKITLKNED